jgi:osmoprotectant transport system substrate-binding protein
MTAEETFDKVQELDAAAGLTWLAPSSADNTYALAVKDGDEKTKDLKTLSDLAAALNSGSELVMAVNAEFPGRPDGLPGLRKAYDFKTSRANLRPMDSGLTYQALRDGQVDLALVFATDGRIKAFNFRVLQDDKQFFPSYVAAPVVRTSVLEANPKLKETLEALSGKLSNETMQQLNAQVDVDKHPIDKVASEFLSKAGLI